MNDFQNADKSNWENDRTIAEMCVAYMNGLDYPETVSHGTPSAKMKLGMQYVLKYILKRMKIETAGGSHA